MLTEILQYLRNWFVRSKYYGDFTIANGTMDLSEILVDGQYFRVVGSALNDGVWKYPATVMKDESFSGAIWSLGIPPAFLSLVAEIEEWQTKNAAVITGPYQSESFENYSYTRATDADGNAAGWQSAFASRLAQWRKL